MPLAFLCIASIIQVSMTTSWELFTVTGNITAQTRIELLRTAVSVPLFVGACFISINAVAFTRIIDAAVAFLLYRPHLDRMTNTNFEDLGFIYMQSAILTLLAITPSVCLMALSADLRFRLPYLVAAIFVGIVLWIFGLFIMRHPLAEEVGRALSSLSQAGKPQHVAGPRSRRPSELHERLRHCPASSARMSRHIVRGAGTLPSWR